MALPLLLLAVVRYVGVPKAELTVLPTVMVEELSRAPSPAMRSAAARSGSPDQAGSARCAAQPRLGLSVHLQGTCRSGTSRTRCRARAGLGFAGSHSSARQHV